jgi:beta-lactam-binding protein with PASTA domain
MPDLVGLPALSAVGMLAKVGIKTAAPGTVDVGIVPVGSGDAAPRLPVKPGQVLTQSPAAGLRVDQSTLVKLTVAK